MPQLPSSPPGDAQPTGSPAPDRAEVQASVPSMPFMDIRAAISGDFDGHNCRFEIDPPLCPQLPVTLYFCGDRLRRRDDLATSVEGEISYTLCTQQGRCAIVLSRAPTAEDWISLSFYTELVPTDPKDTEPKWVSMSVFTALPASVRVQVMAAGPQSPMYFEAAPTGVPDSLEYMPRPKRRRPQ